MKTIVLFFLLFTSTSCEAENIQDKPQNKIDAEQSQIVKSAETLRLRFPAPPGFKLIKNDVQSYSRYLQNLPLKPHGTHVLLYNGQEKINQSAHIAVVDLAIGTRDLHQCADAIMRLRAEYLWKNKKYDQIHFNFTNGFRANYDKWMRGQRIRIKGNKCYWTAGGKASNDYPNFWSYMEMVFSYAGTLSLSRELKVRKMKDMQIGDVLIHGGTPGHAVLVVNMAENINGEKIYMLAQSFMPAQQTQILRNPNDPKLSPWYRLNEHQKIRTPEWTFSPEDLKHF